MEEEAADLLGFPLVDIPTLSWCPARAVITQIVDWLVGAGRVPLLGRETVLADLFQRESRVPISPSLGVAMPGARTCVPDIIGVLARLSHPIVWNGDPPYSVRVVCLLLWPYHLPGSGLRALKAVSDVFCRLRDERSE